MRKIRTILAGASITVAVMFLATASSAKCAELSGVVFPDKLEVGGKSLVLNGMGIREGTRFRVKAYVAGLYLENKSGNPRKIIRSKEMKYLELKFVANVNDHSIMDAWDQGFSNSAGADVEKFKVKIEMLKKWTKGISSGETFGFTYISGKGIEVQVKGKVKGTIDGEDFAQSFFGIWLGEKPVSLEMKTGLLGRTGKEE